MSMKLTLVGTGTPRPTKNRVGSCSLLAFGEETFLIDCGPGSVRRLVERDVELTRITRLFLTHLHYDHCADYSSLALMRWDQGSGRIQDLAVYGPPPMRRMTELLFGSSGVYGPDLDARTQHPGSHFIYEARGGVLPRRPARPAVTELRGGGALEGNGWRVTMIEAVHCQPQLASLAYRIEAEGTSVVFTGDTAPFGGLTTFARRADILVHMCHMINGAVTDERITACCSGHCDAARTARDAECGTLVLVHMTDQFDEPGTREAVIHEVSAIFEGTVIFGQDLLDVPMGACQPAPIR